MQRLEQLQFWVVSNQSKDPANDRINHILIVMTIEMMTGLQEVWSWKKVDIKHDNLSILSDSRAPSQNFCRNFLPADLVGSPRKHHLSFEDPCLIPLEGEYTYIYTYIHTYIHIYNYIYISWDWLILPQNWKWPWVCGSKIISSWPYWGKPPIIFHQFPIDSVLDIFHGQNGRKTEPSQSEASYIVDDCTYPQYILTISPSGIGPNPHHIPNDHRSLHELPLFTTQPRAQRGPLVNYLATACGGDQNILGDRIKHPSPQL